MYIRVPLQGFLRGLPGRENVPQGHRCIAGRCEKATARRELDSRHRPRVVSQDGEGLAPREAKHAHLPVPASRGEDAPIRTNGRVAQTGAPSHFGLALHDASTLRGVQPQHRQTPLGRAHHYDEAPPTLGTRQRHGGLRKELLSNKGLGRPTQVPQSHRASLMGRQHHREPSLG